MSILLEGTTRGSKRSYSEPGLLSGFFVYFYTGTVFAYIEDGILCLFGWSFFKYLFNIDIDFYIAEFFAGVQEIYVVKLQQVCCFFTHVQAMCVLFGDFYLCAFSSRRNL